MTRRSPFSTGYVASKIRRHTARKNTSSKPFIDQGIHNTLNSPQQGPTYFVRPAGSFVVGQTRDKTDAAGGEEIAHWLMSLDGWREVTDKVRDDGAGFGQVRYFQTDVPDDCEAYEGILLWGELTPAQKATVRVQEAHHAANKEELVTSEVPLKRARLISILVGAEGNPHANPEPGEQIIYTWYPGRITPFRSNENLQQALEDDTLDYYATVKSLVPARRNGWF